MRRKILTSNFLKRLALFIRRHPELEDKAHTTMARIVDDHGQTLMHALHGELKGLYAARISQSYRLVFALEPGAIIFIDIGSHDEVY